ncbi:MAG: type IV pilus modification protein PilV [Gammaproteobacteria bacterium]
MTHLNLRPLRRTRGFTLTEALVALLVLSIGLLGVAGLQIASLRASGGSAKRSQATFLAYDIIDRMRANSKAVDQYILAENASPPSGATLSATDLRSWRANIVDTLPGYLTPAGQSVQPSGSIRRDGQLITVGIVWGDQNDDPATAAAAVRTALRFEMTTRLTSAAAPVATP